MNNKIKTQRTDRAAKRVDKLGLGDYARDAVNNLIKVSRHLERDLARARNIIRHQESNLKWWTQRSPLR